jgi:hypothetical protein
MDELLAEQHTILDRWSASPVNEGAKHVLSLRCLPSHLADMLLSHLMSLTTTSTDVLIK